MNSWLSSNKYLRRNYINLYNLFQILYNFLQRIEAVGILPNLFYEVSIPWSQNQRIITRKLHRPTSLKNEHVKILNKIKLNPTRYEINYTSWPSGIYPRCAELLQHLKNQLTSSTTEQTKEEKSHDHINRGRKRL